MFIKKCSKLPLPHCYCWAGFEWSKINLCWRFQKHLSVGGAQLLVEPNVTQLGGLLPKPPSLSKQDRVSLCCKGLWGDWCLPSFAPVEHGKLRKWAPNAKVSKKDSALFVQGQCLLYIWCCCLAASRVFALADSSFFSPSFHWASYSFFLPGQQLRFGAWTALGRLSFCRDEDRAGRYKPPNNSSDKKCSSTIP